MSTTKKAMRASEMSIVLVCVLAALIIILVGGSVFAATLLLKKSTDATHAQIDANVSADGPARLEQLKAYLAANATGISQTAALTEGLGKYDQNTIVATINGYASKAGVNITSYDFGSGTTTLTPVPAATAGNTVNLTIDSPVKYQNFIIFLRLLEQGLMPAQVTSADVSADLEHPGSVNVGTMVVSVAQ